MFILLILPRKIFQNPYKNVQTTKKKYDTERFGAKNQLNVKISNNFLHTVSEAIESKCFQIFCAIQIKQKQSN